jgi:hypothetical protein
MSELLDLAVKAHGGLDRWNKVKVIKVAGVLRRRLSERRGVNFGQRK